VKITAVDTIRLREFGNLICVRIRTDKGLLGLGGTVMGASAVEAYLPTR
jgi:galactonate dehydratase